MVCTTTQFAHAMMTLTPSSSHFNSYLASFLFLVDVQCTCGLTQILNFLFVERLLSSVSSLSELWYCNWIYLKVAAIALSHILTKFESKYLDPILKGRYYYTTDTSVPHNLKIPKIYKSVSFV